MQQWTYCNWASRPPPGTYMILGHLRMLRSASLPSLLKQHHAPAAYAWHESGSLSTFLQSGIPTQISSNNSRRSMAGRTTKYAAAPSNIAVQNIQIGVTARIINSSPLLQMLRFRSSVADSEECTLLFRVIISLLYSKKIMLAYSLQYYQYKWH
jgi:hypothetical protein